MAYEISESKSLSYDDLLDQQYDRLDQLADLRAHAATIGARVLVREVVEVHSDGIRTGYVYGLSVPGDFPFWRGTLEDAAAKLDDLTRRET
jgi:hypothetical protein